MRKPATSLLAIGLLMLRYRSNSGHRRLPRRRPRRRPRNRPGPRAPIRACGLRSGGREPGQRVRDRDRRARRSHRRADEREFCSAGRRPSAKNFRIRQGVGAATFDRLAIDTSLTTRHDLPLEQASAKRFAHAILRPMDAFPSMVSAKTCTNATRGYTPDLKRIDEAIDHIRPGAATALYDAIYLVSRALDRRKGRKVIVLITDGGDTWSKISYQEAVRSAEEAEAIVYSIIIVPIESSAGRETRRRTCADPALGRYRREILLRDLRRATRRCLPQDQRRTAHPVSAGLLSVAAHIVLGVSPHPGESGGRRGCAGLSSAPPGGLLHVKSKFEQEIDELEW